MEKPSTRDRILISALALLESGGIKAMTQLAVAKAAGIPQGQLTYHFPKRSDLVLEVTEFSLNKIADEIFRYSSASRKTKIPEMVWDLVHNQERVRALLGIITEGDDSAEVRARLVERQERVHALIAAALGRGPTDDKITMIHATLIGFGVLSFLQPENTRSLKKDFLGAFKYFEKAVEKEKR